jgi:hypothetical protein
MSEYVPISQPLNLLNAKTRRTPNAFSHVAVHPLVFSYTEKVFTIDPLALEKIMWQTTAPASGFSILDFSLWPVLDIWVVMQFLGDLLLEGSNFPTTAFGANSREERRWALNIGANSIHYRAVSRYGRFTLINRANAVATNTISLTARSM